MPDKWTSLPLGEITTWFSGGTPPKDDARYWGGSIPWISASSMAGTRFADSNLKLTESGLARGSRLAETGTVLLLVRGSILHQRVPVGMAMRPVAFNQDVKAIRAKAGLDPWFLLYWLMSNESRLLSMVDFTGIGAGRFDTKQLQEMTIAVPPLHEQQEIIRTVKPVDDRIYLAQTITSTLEQIAQAIFQAWFVDFLPVRAKAAAGVAGRDPLRAAMSALSGKDGAAVNALPREQYEQLAATAALFPDELVASEAGPIPLGWKLGKLDDLLVLQRGYDLPTSAREDGNVPVIAASGHSGWHSKPMAKAPGVITGRSGVLGRVFLELRDFWPLNTALWVKEFKLASPYYAFHLLQQLDLEGFNAGSAVPTLNRNHLHGLQQLLPDESAIRAFDMLAKPLYDLTKANEEQSLTLVELRDTLLPKLLSGEIRVGEAQELAKAAV